MSDPTPIEDGQEAERILRSKIYRAAVGFARDSIRSSWEHSADPGEREQLHAELKALRRVENRLAELMQTGRAALEAAKRETAA